MTEDFIARIKRHEGLLLKPYKDTLGKLTIGYGRCVDTNPLTAKEIAFIDHDCRIDAITEPQASYLLANDIEKCEAQMDDNFPFMVENHFSDEMCERQNVLVEMLFQLGLGTVLKFRKFIQALKDEDYAEASAQMLDSTWHKQTKSRCEELAGIMLKGRA